MTFNNAEISTQDGRPIALYLLEWGNTEWCYTSADRDIEYGVDVNGDPRIYTAVAVSDRGMVQGGSSQNDFAMDIPANLPIVALYKGTPPSESIWLTVRRMHIGETDAPIYWIGNVSNVKRTGYVDAQVIGRPLTSSFKRTGLRLCWTRECPHFLYDAGCKLDPEDFRVDVEVASKVGNTLTVTGIVITDEGYYTGGFVSWVATDEGTVERRMVEKQVGGSLTLFGLADGIEVGDELALYPGCNRTPETCKNKFDNIDNYGGYDFMPGKTPFGTIIF